VPLLFGSCSLLLNEHLILQESIYTISFNKTKKQKIAPFDFCKNAIPTSMKNQVIANICISVCVCIFTFMFLFLVCNSYIVKNALCVCTGMENVRRQHFVFCFCISCMGDKKCSNVSKPMQRHSKNG